MTQDDPMKNSHGPNMGKKTQHITSNTGFPMGIRLLSFSAMLCSCRRAEAGEGSVGRSRGVGGGAETWGEKQQEQREEKGHREEQQKLEKEPEEKEGAEQRELEDKQEEHKKEQGDQEEEQRHRREKQKKWREEELKEEQEVDQVELKVQNHGNDKRLGQRWGVT